MKAGCGCGSDGLDLEVLARFAPDVAKAEQENFARSNRRVPSGAPVNSRSASHLGNAKPLRAGAQTGGVDVMAAFIEIRLGSTQVYEDAAVADWEPPGDCPPDYEDVPYSLGCDMDELATKIDIADLLCYPCGFEVMWVDLDNCLFGGECIPCESEPGDVDDESLPEVQASW